MTKKVFSSFLLIPIKSGQVSKKQKFKTAKEMLKQNIVLFLTQEKNQKNMHLKRIAKILFRFAKINKLASLKQNLSFNAALHKIFRRNSFNVQEETIPFQIIFSPRERAGRRNLFEVGGRGDGK